VAQTTTMKLLFRLPKKSLEIPPKPRFRHKSWLKTPIWTPSVNLARY